MCDIVKIVTSSRSKSLGCEAVTISELADSIFCVQKSRTVRMLKIQAASSSETSVIIDHSTRCHIPNKMRLCEHLCESLKSNIQHVVNHFS
jgi:hypothetical protein